MKKITNKVDGFQYTTSIKKLRKLTRRIRGVPGGTSAGKTYGIIPILIDYAIKNPRSEISIVSETIPHLRRGALKDFLKIMKATGRYQESCYNKTLLTYTFTNESYIEFFSVQQEDKVKGPRRNVLYINECDNVNFETYHQLLIRTDLIVWLDFNPVNRFWYHDEVSLDPDFEELVLTYQDNEALSESIISEIEKAKTKAYINPDLRVPDLFNPENIISEYWHNWWKVYGLGMLGSLEGTVFTNWSQIGYIPPEARLIGYGMDFGFTNDPTTLIGVYQYDGKLLLDEIIYSTGMLNSDIARVMRSEGVIPSSAIIADSADPKSIAEISRYGFNIHPVEKGKDSIVFGIGLMQEFEILITERSTNLIKEFRNYLWEKDKTGKTLNVPIDAFNHGIDAVRYLTLMKLGKRRQTRGIRRRN